jgi:NAD(P)-dependent dehydrogenase (short-subunit alcohol dehydrogenase family)
METAVHLAERGFYVCATMRDLARRARLDAAHAERPGNGDLEILRLDVTDEAAVEAVVDDVVARHGGIYGVVNNAGVILRGFFEDLDDAEIRRVVETNVFGTMAVTRAVLPHMRRAETGRIVIVGSIGGRLGAPAVSAYCASKFALEGFGEALAQEVEPFGVRVALVAPAMIQTDVWGPNRGVARGSSNPDSPYYGMFQREERWADDWMKSSPTRPDDVARVVHRALTADHPKLRYIVGTRAARMLALRRLLPGELFERIYARVIMRHVAER